MNDPLGLTPPFPPGFVWGVATSAYQIEGAARVDGRGPSIWDTFCRVPGAIADGCSGDVACDHYHRWATDLDLVKSLGVEAYRFSIAWPRVRPDGHGAFNAAGMDFYDKLVDGLLARGVTPYITLNHWDLPQALQDEGGWGARDTVHRFVEYARHVHARLGDRVRSITTHNEPWVMAVLGHQNGIFAPGLKHRPLAMQVSHHLLLSHGLALQALRADGAKAELGIVLNLAPFHPATDAPADHDKARLEDGLLRRWYLDPIYHAKYPEDVLAELGPDAPLVQRGDMADIAQPIDFLGVNYYSRSVVSAAEPWDAQAAGHETTAMGWEIYPQGLTELLVALGRDYPVPALIVTENGGAFADELSHGRVHDADRARYLATHVAAVSDAIAQGAPVHGYMVWSLLDNFEWASGYDKRFGIVHVDYATQRRTLKDSALWYRDFLARQRQR
ncbi:beta-glucosidase [Aquincola sp. S2]|uniref:Beta-glucosidase n=1 Tax=Pseudaquabacterium terrae TaxID=2732868 RepID=A0ABX2ECY8_9BURK|nr:GH1 family beta-glucosidase [Aquabacterium terrae]NRF65770.1 beta-glucosidase [Aquabacterium terrae]